MDLSSALAFKERVGLCAREDRDTFTCSAPSEQDARRSCASQAATRQGSFPMRAQVSLLIALACVACRPAARPAHTAQDSAGSSALDLPSAVEGVCETVATLWRATGQAQVRLADTTMPVVSDSMTQRGCAVVATAPMGLDSTRWASLYWTTSQRRGWAELSDYAADGPDGSSRTLERQGVRCQIAVTQDGGDDSDSTYVPSPAVGEATFCWRTSS